MSTKVRNFLLAVVAGYLFAQIWGVGYECLQRQDWWPRRLAVRSPLVVPVPGSPHLSVRLFTLHGLVRLGPTLVVSVGVYALLARRRNGGDNYTRCRTCQHILRGLTQPRCPECGEAI